MEESLLGEAWFPYTQNIDTEFNVESTYQLQEKGLVLSGTIVKGGIYVG